MKLSICDLLLPSLIVFCATGEAAPAEPFPAEPSGETYRSRLFENTWVSKITDEAIDKSPNWDAASENPPLSAKKALKLSLPVAERLAKAEKKGFDAWKIELEGATLKKSGKHWIWKVQYTWHRGGIGTGVPPFADIIVLMDGTVVEPKIDPP